MLDSAWIHVWPHIQGRQKKLPHAQEKIQRKPCSFVEGASRLDCGIWLKILGCQHPCKNLWVTPKLAPDVSNPDQRVGVAPRSPWQGTQVQQHWQGPCFWKPLGGITSAWPPQETCHKGRSFCLLPSPAIRESKEHPRDPTRPDEHPEAEHNQRAQADH